MLKSMEVLLKYPETLWWGTGKVSSVALAMRAVS
jgi:hypothetical protein